MDNCFQPSVFNVILLAKIFTILYELPMAAARVWNTLLSAVTAAAAEVSISGILPGLLHHTCILHVYYCALLNCTLIIVS